MAHSSILARRHIHLGQTHQRTHYLLLQTLRQTSRTVASSLLVGKDLGIHPLDQIPNEVRLLLGKVQIQWHTMDTISNRRQAGEVWLNTSLPLHQSLPINQPLTVSIHILSGVYKGNGEHTLLHGLKRGPALMIEPGGGYDYYQAHTGDTDR